MKRLIFALSVIVLAVGGGEACFDTYLFLNKYSMVYPKGKFVSDVLLEYSGNSVVLPENDTFFANLNFFYGITDGLSLQLGIASKEITRTEVLEVEGFGIRLVYNLLSQVLPFADRFTVDVILEHHQAIFGRDMTFEFSVPGIFYVGSVVGVVHPVFTLADLEKEVIEYSLGGHVGLFYLIGNSALVGLGAEYQSAQNGSTFGSRLIEGEAGVSVFFGAKLGDNFYLQNEFAKGIANARDFGIAFTLKVIPW
ncbi:MAG: hypothetical protein ABDH28_00445 [Brevinematia bacterium]